MICKELDKSLSLFLHILYSIIYISCEGCGHSAHNWSFRRELVRFPE